MNHHRDAIRVVAAAVAAAFGLALANPAGAACSVNSGNGTAALIELYTSEGCSSCPPAEKTLAHLQPAASTQAGWYAMALHVDYWDYIGWRDPYAQPAFSERHHWLVRANQHRTVYTPHFFVSGAEQSGDAEDLRAEVDRLNRNPAKADIHLELTDGANGVQGVHATARAAAASEPLALYLALTENHLSSRVTRGENGGSTLNHEHVVRSWMGPFQLVDGVAQVRHDLAPAEKQRLAQGEMVAFVENERTGQVLQAVGTPACKG